MPTITMHCQPLWLPMGKSQADLTPEARATYFMGVWLREAVPDVINSFDKLRGKDAIVRGSVWVNFVPISSMAINAAQVLAVVNPPEVDGDFQFRKHRREVLASVMRARMAIDIATNLSKLFIPEWEIEVIPEQSSGFGMDPEGKIKYQW